jgi:hypothetical protein
LKSLSNNRTGADSGRRRPLAVVAGELQPDLRTNFWIGDLVVRDGRAGCAATIFTPRKTVERALEDRVTAVVRRRPHLTWLVSAARPRAGEQSVG